MVGVRDLHDSQMAVGACGVQRRPAEAIHRVNVCFALQKHRHNVCMSIRRRKHERSPSVGVCCARASAVRSDEQRHFASITAGACRGKRRAATGCIAETSEHSTRGCGCPLNSGAQTELRLQCGGRRVCLGEELCGCGRALICNWQGPRETRRSLPKIGLQKEIHFFHQFFWAKFNY
jgi:hypothetical protein